MLHGHTCMSIDPKNDTELTKGPEVKLMNPKRFLVGGWKHFTKLGRITGKGVE